MSLEYLEDLEHSIDSGHHYYACPGQGSNQWYVSTSLRDLGGKAKRVCVTKRYPVTVYRLVNKDEAFADDSFLVVRKILPSSSSREGDPHIQWILVDTREAAEMLRDVSCGPTPYFGAVIQEVHKPESDDKD